MKCEFVAPTLLRLEIQNFELHQLQETKFVLNVKENLKIDILDAFKLNLYKGLKKLTTTFNND